VASGELQRLAMEKGFYSPQNAGRRLRELECDNLLDVEYRHGHAWYRAKVKLNKIGIYSEGKLVGVKYESNPI